MNIYDIGDEDVHHTHIHKDMLKTHRAWYGYGIIFCVDRNGSKVENYMTLGLYCVSVRCDIMSGLLRIVD